jgi:hypothetical protein
MAVRVPPWCKPAIWGAVVGIVVVWILGFAWWGWVLSSTAEHMAKERADAAVIALLTPVCVERFMQQPEAMAKLTEFQQIAVWQRSQFVEKGGWATAPGSTTPHGKVARACAEQLTKTKT